MADPNNFPPPPPITFITGTPTSGVPSKSLPEVGYYARSKIAGTSADFYVQGAGPLKTSERKTELPNKNLENRLSPTVVNAAKIGPSDNILKAYRSVNYNFTLAALTQEQVNDPKQYVGKVDYFQYIVATSKGKGSKEPAVRPEAIDQPITQFTPRNLNDSSTENGSVNSTSPRVALSGTAAAFQNARNQRADVQQQMQADTATRSEFINDFNKYDSGKFDIFIDNVVIDHQFTFDEESTMTTPMMMTFDIIEPYSLTGFLNALLAAAIGAGYKDIKSAVFVLVMDFIGYPDSQVTPGSPSAILQSDRYFAIRFMDMKTSVDQRGTVYQCKAQPITEAIYGTSINEIKTPTKVVGKTVKEMLLDLENQLNDQAAKNAAAKGINGYDSYKISFPDFDNDANISSGENEIARGEMLRDGGKGQPFLANFISPDFVNSGASRTLSATDLQPTAQFTDGESIQKIIARVVHSSSYVQKKIDGFTSGNPTAYYDPKTNLVDYFIITAKSSAPDPKKINPETKRPYQEYNFQIRKHKILFNSLLPEQGQQAISLTQEVRQALSTRTYEYIYSGVNTDIMDFQIRFNNLLLLESVTGLGNSDGNASTQLAAPDNANTVRAVKDSISELDAQIVSTPTMAALASAGRTTPSAPNAGMPATDNSYQAMSNITWRNAVNLDTGLMSCDLTILGDPYFLVMGGMSNYAPTGHQIGSPAANGEASTVAGQVFITVNFRNPKDINANGEYEFDENLASYSGLFSIIKVRSEFRNGLFKQSLKLIRAPGQQPPVSVDRPTTSKPVLQGTPKQGSQYSPTTAPASGVSNSTSVSADTAQVGVGVSNSVETVPSQYRLTPTLTPDKLSSTLRLGKSSIKADGSTFALTSQGASKEAAATVASVSNLLGSTPSQVSALSAASGIQTSSLYSLGNAPAALIGGVGLKITGALDQVNNSLSGLSSKLSSAANFSLANTKIPENVNLSNLGGLLTSKISYDLWQNVPASQPKGTVAPTTAWPEGDLAAEKAADTTNNPLSNIKPPQPNVSLGALVGTLLTGAALIKSLTNHSTSVESNITQTQQITGSKIGGNMNTAAVTRYGSTGAKISPLSKYVKK